MTADTPLYPVFTGELEGLVRFFDYGDEELARREKELTLQQFHDIHPCCPIEVLQEGLEFVLENSKARHVVYSLYTLSERGGDERRKDVRLFAFAAERSNKPAVIICAGGGYGCVCNLVEGFPVAMRFARLGFPVFVLNYRVGRVPVLPSALEDLERAVKFAVECGAAFGGNGEYALCGFSAGAHLITQWGTDNLGYNSHQMQAPKALAAIYPAISDAVLFTDLRYRDFVKLAFGSSPDKSLLEKYDVYSHANGFPPVYMALGEQDDLISKEQLAAFCAFLNGKGIAAKLDLFPCAPHGFGDGSATGAEGWIGRAAAFLTQL